MSEFYLKGYFLLTYAPAIVACRDKLSIPENEYFISRQHKKDTFTALHPLIEGRKGCYPYCFRVPVSLIEGSRLNHLF